ncbi:MAG: PIN domain-containing protein [Desulfovermiculus sp.]|nr:PIN domain-containing protein [Desulfovermiculus sp.]
MKVVLDTNVVFNDWELRKPSFQLLSKYARLSGAASIIVLEIVFLEAVANYEEQVRQQFEAAARAKARLNGFGVSEALQPTMKSPAESAEVAARDYSTRLRKRIDETAASPDHKEIAHQDLLNRCFSKRKPFRESGKGYRDTLIWEVLMRQVASNEDITYLVTRESQRLRRRKRKELASRPLG